MTSTRPADAELRVLSLVTNHRARFYRQQVDRLRGRGIGVDVLTVPDGDGGGRGPHDYARFYVAAFRASRGAYDLVHANYGLSAPPAVIQRNHPTVVSLWGSDLLGTYGPIGRLSARLADEVIVMSPEMAAELDGDCHVIAHGVDSERFRPEPQADCQETLGWAPGSAHVLFPYPPTRDVKDYPRAERLAAAAEGRLSRPVELHTVSGVDHEEMYRYMNAADALLLTSRREGSPNSVKEAMACNLPVVATDVGDVADRLADVEPSAVHTDDDALVDALVDILRRGERSDGRERIAEISLAGQIDRLVGVYRRACDD
ncbi:glycosyltransferase [Halohasta salina]|uniref:glycosyltransferase n=1 Tax=Halohasta salina TaxID=2961621 RepID=UPI0020A52237|nr:glycosyltransferase [Halohasta salina]